MDILAANQLMTALSPMYRPGSNILRAAFQDRAVDELYGDPEERLPQRRRRAAGASPPGRRRPAAGGAGRRAVTEERGLPGAVVPPRRAPPGRPGVHRLRHPLAGDLELSYDKFLLAGPTGRCSSSTRPSRAAGPEEALAFLAAAPTKVSRPGSAGTTGKMPRSPADRAGGRAPGRPPGRRTMTLPSILSGGRLIRRFMLTP